jgi:hypothetical protein
LDVCSMTIGPRYEITRVTNDNWQIYLQFDKEVKTKRRSFSKTDLSVVLTGIETLDGKTAKFQISAKVEDFFFESGRLILNFNGLFTV